jgi:hypothetical protein
MENSFRIFDKPIPEKDLEKARRTKAKYIRKFGDDSGREYHLAMTETPVVGKLWNMQSLSLSDATDGEIHRQVGGHRQHPHGLRPLPHIHGAGLRGVFAGLRAGVAGSELHVGQHLRQGHPLPERPLFHGLPLVAEVSPVQQASCGTP